MNNKQKTSPTWFHQFYHMKQYQMWQPNGRDVGVFCLVIFNMWILMRSLWFMLTPHTVVILGSSDMSDAHLENPLPWHFLIRECAWSIIEMLLRHSGQKMQLFCRRHLQVHLLDKNCFTFFHLIAKQVTCLYRQPATTWNNVDSIIWIPSYIIYHISSPDGFAGSALQHYLKLTIYEPVLTNHQWSLVWFI